MGERSSEGETSKCGRPCGGRHGPPLCKTLSAGCDSPQEDNQRWTWDDQTSTIASFEVIQKHVPFVVTVCTKGKLGNETGY